MSVFSQYANNVETPLFSSMRQAQNTNTQALNQLGVSQNSSPPLIQLHYWLAHLAYILSLNVKIIGTSFTFTLLKISENKRHFFLHFSRYLSNWPGSLTTLPPSPSTPSPWLPPDPEPPFGTVLLSHHSVPSPLHNTVHHHQTSSL